MWLSKVRADANGDRSVWGNFWFDLIGRNTSAGQRVTPDSSLGLTAVWTSVRVLSESFAVLPFRMYTPKASGGRKQITKHWLYQLLAKAPNQYQNPFEFREMLQGHTALRGNAYCEITPDGRGGIASLMPLHPDRMTVEMLPDGNYRYAYRMQNGETVRFTRAEIFHIRGLSSDGIVGMSPIEVARNSIGEGLAQQDYAARFFANDAKPGGGWIEYPGKFATNEVKKTFRNSWQEMQGGKNRSKVAVLENGMKFHELGMKNSDAQFIESRAAKVTEVARIFRIPPHKIMDLSRSTNNNIEQQAIEFWQDCMLPWTERWEAAIEFQLLGPDTEFECEFDMRRMMRADSTARGIYYNNGILSGWLTRNEARDEEGLDPIEGLDEPLTPMNMQTQDQGVDTGVEGAPALPAPGAPPPGAPPAAPVPPEPAKAPVKPTKKAAADRLELLIASNAGRMARRISAGQAPTADVLGQALAIDEKKAIEWLATLENLDENAMRASLVALALES